MTIKLLFSHDVRLTVDFPEYYPSSDPPVFELSGPTLSGDQRMELLNALNDSYAENAGSPVLFIWINLINEFLESISTMNKTDAVNEDHDGSDVSATTPPRLAAESTLDIRHGAVFTDRKSHFQAHLCRVHSKGEVDTVMAELLRNGKIARATHNMYAWRIVGTKDGREFRMHDNFDDGETGASSKMLELLGKMGAENILVVVTRWYGGIHLGPDRFRHINNLTREIVAEHGLDQRTSQK